MKLVKLVCLLLLIIIFVQAGSLALAAGNTELTTVIPAQPGDTNGDNKVNASDIIHLIKFVLNSKTPTSCEYDYNGDGWVGLADIVRLLRYVISPNFELYKTT